MPSSRSRVEGGALLAVVGLLCVLAVVQHQWLGAIAEGERRKLREEATEKATAIANDVDRELTRAFLELRIDAETLDHRDGPAFSERYERWRDESDHADLVKAIYVAEGRKDGQSLLRFDPNTRAFVEAPWPASFAPVQSAFEGGAAQHTALPVAASLPRVMAEVPALISPVLRVVIDARQLIEANGPAQIREMFLRHTGPGPVEIIQLDPDYLREKLIGARASSRLGSDAAFLWSVVRVADGATVVGEAAAHDSKGDATASLLRLRLDDLERSLLRGVLPGLSEVVSESSVRVMVQVGGPSGGTTAHVSRSSPSDAPWTLVLRHKEGSIDAAVSGQQLRNTALSASILGVLGLSAGLVFFSARRLRAIATQQVEFVAAVSHELRTPLAVIRSAADNLADGVVQDASQTKRYGALIRDESVRLTDMVEHVLEFAGADSPGREARGPIDPVEAARSAVAGMEALAAERGALLTVEASGTPLQVNGDLSHITRAVSNLLGNALKYGGHAPRVTVRVQGLAGGVEITVTDQGSGLSSSEIPRLFEPFYRGARASEAQIPGSGLGLALVKRIVESHGGRVSAANGTPAGARFTITLPSA